MHKTKNETSDILYWVTKDENGNIIHTGELLPGQEVVTSIETFIDYTNEIDQIEEIESQIGPQPAFNYKFDNFSKNWKFRDTNRYFIPVASHVADQLNDAIAKCIKGSRSGKYAETITHKLWPSYVLYVINESDVVPIGASVNITVLQNVLNTIVADGGITQAEADELVTNVQNNLGTKVRILDLIPASWSAYVVSEKQALFNKIIDDNDF